MMIFYRLGVISLLLFAIFGGGFFYGYNYSRLDGLKNAVEAFQTREAINNDIKTMSSFDLCRALGGMSDECSDIVLRLDEAAQN